MKLLLTSSVVLILVATGFTQGTSKPLNKKDRALFKAVQIGSTSGVRKQIRAGANLNAKGYAGMTPLHEAVSRGHRQVVELLIINKADVNAKFQLGSFKGQTPLDRLMLTGSKKVGNVDKKIIATLLRKNGAKHGTLHGAVAGRDIKAIKLFLANKANVNAQNAFGLTPLDHVVSSNSLKDKKFAGGTPQNKSNNVLPILPNKQEKATGNKEEKAIDKAIVDLLREHGGKTGEELKAAGN